jgi:hypothetical protein
MFRPRIAATLLAVVILAGTSLSASAQTPSTSAIPPIDQFTGIQAAASRTFGQDVESMLAATPDLDMEAIFRGLVSTSVIVLEFDNAANAATAYDQYSAGIAEDIPTMAQGGTPEVSTGDLADVGDRATMARLYTATSDEYETWLEFVTVQDERYVYVVTSLTAVEDKLGMATSVAAWVAQNGAPDGTEAIFAADGGSEGGLWGFMPPIGDDVLKGLIPIVDEILYPAPGA